MQRVRSGNQRNPREASRWAAKHEGNLRVWCPRCAGTHHCYAENLWFRDAAECWRVAKACYARVAALNANHSLTFPQQLEKLGVLPIKLRGPETWNEVPQGSAYRFHSLKFRFHKVPHTGSSSTRFHIKVPLLHSDPQLPVFWMCGMDIGLSGPSYILCFLSESERGGLRDPHHGESTSREAFKRKRQRESWQIQEISIASYLNSGQHFLSYHTRRKDWPLRGEGRDIGEEAWCIRPEDWQPLQWLEQPASTGPSAPCHTEAPWANGDTPPPKQPRHAWQEASSKFSWSPTATFFGALAGCMLWRSLCPGIAILWYFLPWLVFAFPYQSFLWRREWFHVTLCFASTGFNSSVLLLAPRSCNIWSWFGRLLAFLMESSTYLELCISMCSHAFMKESWNGMAPRWNSSKQSPRPSKDEYYVLFFAATQFHAHLELPWTLGLPSFAFDCTKGYPGEGPDSWCITTANIDSLAAHPSVLSWDSDVLLLQETRCGENTLPASYASAAAAGWKMVHGLPVPKLRMKNNVSRTNHGGVAMLGKPGLVKPFVPPPEVKDTWTKLYSTCRIAGCWVQATPSTRVLVFSFYGVTRASICATSAALTNDYLGMLFTVASAFGQVPIIIGGDFQSDPSTYKSVQEAAATGEWHDPLIQYDQEGLPHRPPTFRSSTDDASIGSSSIDGLLVNTVALFAMDSIEIVDYQNKCHLPVKATFKWLRLQQTVWQRPAALDLGALQAPSPDDPLCPHQQNATSLWVNQYAPCTADSLTSDQWLQKFNDLAVDTLLLGGAKWLHGDKSRGAPPRYKKITVYNGQLSSGDAATKDLRWIQKTLAMTNEALFRNARQATTPGDIRTTANLLYKLRHRVFSAGPSLPNLRSSWMEGLAVVRDALTILASTRKESLRSTRIKEWKNKIKENCRSTAVGPVVFKYLRKKVQKHPANLLEDHQGNIITDPPKALAAFAEKWDEVFSANILLPREEQVLAPIIPLIETVRKDIALPTLGAIDFFQQAQARRKDAAGGMDGWATCELQCLPPQAFIPLAELFHRVELGQLELPSQMTLARQIILDKGGPDVPLAKRLICILPVTMVLYTSLRYKQLGQWQAQCLPRELYGGVPGRRMCDLTTQIKLDLDKGHTTRCGLIGVKLDKTKCFDRLTPRISALLMLAFGLPLTLVRVFLGLYNTAKRVVFYTRWALPVPISTASGVFQGCSLSLLCINLHMAVWALILRNVPQIKPFAFIDDSYILGDKDAIPQLQLAVDLTRLWDNLTGQALNEYKCNIFASSPGLRDAMRLAFPAMNMVEIVEIVGTYLQTSRRNQTGYPKPKVAAALTDCKLIATLPTTLQVREHLLATKVIPRIAFTPGMTRIPKAILEKLQSAIAETIWKDRPMWRSRGLLFAVLAKPHRTEPICARAYITLLETMDYLNRSPGARDIWETLFEAEEHLQSSLITAVLHGLRFIWHWMVLTFSAQHLGQSFLFLFKSAPAEVMCPSALQHCHDCQTQGCCPCRRLLWQASFNWVF